jgi:hypothetical protein
MRSFLRGLRPHTPLGLSALLFAIAAIVNGAASPAYADLLAQATSCSGLGACVIDTEMGVDTGFGPLANAGVIDAVNVPPVFGYLGQATGQAGFGHVGTAAELQASADSGFPSGGIGATGNASATDILKFSTGNTVQFGYTLHLPTVDLCGLSAGPSGPCDISLARALSSFSAFANPEYTFATNSARVGYEVDDNFGTVTTEILGKWNPQTGVLLSDPISLIDPFTGQIVPGVDVTIASTSLGMAMGRNPAANEQITRAAAIFNNTGTLTTINVFDAAGNLIPDVAITSASGTVYPLAETPAPSAVPESSTLPLVALGLGMVAAVAGLRRVKGCPTRR